MEAAENMTLMVPRTASLGHIRRRFYFARFAALATLVIAPAGWAQQVSVQLDPAQTKIEFKLGSTLHTVEGTFKLKGGTIRFDPSSGKMSGSITVDATSGESGNGGRDRKMHREILESGKYPEIVFTPTQVKGIFDPKGPSRLEDSGQFNLHRQDHDLTLPIETAPAGPQLRMATHITSPYIKWELKNPSTLILLATDNVA